MTKTNRQGPPINIAYGLATMILWCALSSEFWRYFEVSVALGYAIKTFVVGVLAVPTWVDRFPTVRHPSHAKRSVLALTAGVAIGAIWICFEFFRSPVAIYLPHEIQNSALRLGFIVARVIGGVAVAPWVEEYFWREILLNEFRSSSRSKIFQGSKTRRLWAYGIVSTIGFTAFHPHHLWPVALFSGIGFTWIRIKTEELQFAWLAHLAANALVSTVVLATGNWSLW